MLLVKITIMDIQYKAALLQLMKITFEELENNDLNLILIHSSSSNDDEDEEETVRNIKKIIKLILYYELIQILTKRELS